MDANYIYDVFETTRKRRAPDLNIGLAMLQETQPLPEDATEKDVREFLGRHYESLVEAYRLRDRAAFAQVVANCQAEDRLLEAERAKAEQSHADLS